VWDANNTREQAARGGVGDDGGGRERVEEIKMAGEVVGGEVCVRGSSPPPCQRKAQYGAGGKAIVQLNAHHACGDWRPRQTDRGALDAVVNTYYCYCHPERLLYVCAIHSAYYRSIRCSMQEE
jgi:hypothetical protein